MTWSQAQRSPAHLSIFCEHPMKRKLAQNEGVKNLNILFQTVVELRGCKRPCFR